MSVQIAVFYWDNDIALGYLDQLEDRFRVPGFVISDFAHETVLLNRAIDFCEADFLWMLTPDVVVPYDDTLDKILEVMDNPKVGAVLPNRQNDIGVGGNVPYKKYLGDGTALLLRMSIKARYDEEFIFTGWSDLDIGNEIERLGYEVWVDPRTAVHKKETAYGSWSSFREAYNARNRLLLEAKWHWVGYDDWRGISFYNLNCARNRRIPTEFELAWWSGEEHDRFAKSVYMEQPWILLKDNQGTGNEEWTFEN